jgi:hypothetical protein
MIPSPCRGRSGITLTEILISIMIMGIGLVSLATLFPLGLLRLQAANRATRSVFLTESAMGDISGRNLLYKPSFTMSWYAFDPFVRDPATLMVPGPGDLQMTAGSGLPVCYDPLWWGTIMSNIPTATPANSAVRFGSGLGFVRSDPGGTNPAAYGLQRLTNFPKYFPTTGSYYPIDDLAASPDDIIWQEEGLPNVSDGIGSPVVPVMVSATSLLGPAPLADLRYTWFLTCQQHDVTDGKTFDGNVVVCHNRPFATENVIGPVGGSTVVRASGETVVEAVFAYGPPGASGYAPNDTTILLRWPSGMPDPEIHVGNWIADVTYDLSMTNSTTKFYGTPYPGQRCHWYRVAKKSEVGVDPWSSSYRRMVVTTAQPVRARTQLNASGQPVYVNTALVMPSVVNVTSRVFTVRNSGETKDQ